MGENEIKVSVIMPSLNVADYILESIYSVQNQTLKELEILCIDAGSTDGTQEILRRLTEQDSRIRLIISPQKSYGHQINMGISEAKGKYIAIVETDDYIERDMYEKLYVSAESGRYDFVKADYYSYYTQKNGERVFFERRNISVDDVYNITLCPKENFTKVYTDFHNWTGVYRKDFLLDNEILLSETSGAAFQDIGFVFQTLLKAKKIRYLRDCLYRYCTDRDGSSTNSNKTLGYAYYEYHKIWKQYIENSKDDSVASFFYTRMAMQMIYCYSQYDFEKVSIEDEKYYNWFKEKLSVAREKGLIQLDAFKAGMGEKLDILLKNKEEFRAKFFDSKAKIVKDIKEKGVKVIIFGCGKTGYLAYKYLIEKGITPFAFMDNNKALWGKEYNELPILSTENIEKGNYYVIANEIYYSQIFEQLVGENVDERSIGFFVN